MLAQSFIFLHGNAVRGSMKYLKKNFKKLKYFMKYFKGNKTCFFYISKHNSTNERLP